MRRSSRVLPIMCSGLKVKREPRTLHTNWSNMRITCVRIRNFRALKETPIISFSQMPVIIGRNDSGKSSILHALGVFFETRPLSESDFHKGSAEEENIEIEIDFADFGGN